ncbi:MAG: VWA domain-containing protein, partial [Leeuwenhoekiella sp.]
MSLQTIIFIVLAGIIALIVSLLYYFKNKKNHNRRNLLFSMLRFFSLFSLLILLIDPQFESTTYITVKPVLAVAIDNSASIKHLDNDERIREVLKDIQQNSSLKGRFDIDFYKFGSDIQPLDSLKFDDDRTDLTNPLSTFDAIYKETYIPLLITDGNATLGADYEYYVASQQQPLYILVAGDTSSYEDVKIDRINVNRYAYLDNEFPVEIISSYSGSAEVEIELNVFSGKKKVFSKTLEFSDSETGKVTNLFLKADQVGVKQYTVQLRPLENEKNITNNEKNFGVEVIDQQAKIAIVYSFVHPDLGALKKSIEKNKLRDVELIDIKDFQPNLVEKNDLLILFEPSRDFGRLYEALEKSNKNR